MANGFDDLTRKQAEATKALERLTSELRRTSQAQGESPGVALVRPGASFAAEQPSASEANEATAGGLGVREGFRDLSRSMAALSSGLTSNTRALRDGASLTASLVEGALGGVLQGFSPSRSGGSLLKSGLGLTSLAGLIGKLFRRGGGDEPMFVEHSLPPSIQIEAANTERVLAGFPRTASQAGGAVRMIPDESAPRSTHITVNVNALDSQSFMDRSHDIARAVQDAMIHMHPVNDVIAEL